MIVYGLDPGTAQSGIVCYDDDARRVISSETIANDDVLRLLADGVEDEIDALVIEKIESMGMAVGATTLDTVFWAGRFAQQWRDNGWHQVTRREVKLYLCGSMRAKDANVRQALMDMFGGDAAKGTKSSPGPLHGVKGHEFAALAVAITWLDTKREKS